MKDLSENKKKKRFFIKGLVFALPVFLTSWILYKIVIFMSSITPEIIIKMSLEGLKIGENTASIISIIFGFACTVIIIYSLGIVVSITGKKFLEKIEDNFLFKIPVFNTVYKTIKQIVESVSNPDRESFKKVVMVEFPRKGVWTMGFVTGESKDKKDLEYYHVIVPTTPNPTSAFLLFILKSEVKETGMSIDEGVKTIISGGVLTSDVNKI
tara:strand:- start:394 stop:1026 length:633 start_codon:yes stop_codon:yes gene_type:complete